MAREVYFDPYGSYTRAYDQGTARENETQRNVREARQQDFNFYGMAPLQLDNARLENRFNNAAYDRRVDALEYADIIGKNQAGKSMLETADAASFMGNYAPFAQAQQYLYGYQSQVMPDGSIQLTHAGQPMGQPVNSRDVSEPWYRRGEWYDRRDKGFDQQIQGIGATVAQQNADTSRFQADAYSKNMWYQTQAGLQKAAMDARAAATGAGGAGAIAPVISNIFPQTRNAPPPAHPGLPSAYSPWNVPQPQPQPANPNAIPTPVQVPQGALTPEQVYQMYLQYLQQNPQPTAPVIQ